MNRFPYINFPFQHNNRRFPHFYTNSQSPSFSAEFHSLKNSPLQTVNHTNFKDSERTQSLNSFQDVPSIPYSNIVSNPCHFDEPKNKSNNNGNDYLFDLFGLKIYTDDLLLVSLIYFLYSEGVKDEGLFIVLILLLLS